MFPCRSRFRRPGEWGVRRPSGTPPQHPRSFSSPSHPSRQGRPGYLRPMAVPKVRDSHPTTTSSSSTPDLRCVRPLPGRSGSEVSFCPFGLPLSPGGPGFSLGSCTRGRGGGGPVQTSTSGRCVRPPGRWGQRVKAGGGVGESGWEVGSESQEDRATPGVEFVGTDCTGDRRRLLRPGTTRTTTPAPVAPPVVIGSGSVVDRGLI